MSQVIPKRKVEVRVHLVDGEVCHGSVFLDYIDVIHRGEQTLLDKLNDDYLWFPMGGDGLQILNRSHVILVEPETGLAANLVCSQNSPVYRREHVTVRLQGGREIDGQIAMDLPDDFSRVSDFLNFPQNFFAVETSRGPVLVSKEHVISLTPHERPPALPDATDSEIGERA